MPNLIDLSGQRFGRLVVRGPVGRSNGQLKWECVCDCGNVRTIAGMSLREGNTRSCGCLKRDVTRERCRHDLAGKKFGRLTVLRETDRAACGRIRWLCLCECGKESEVFAESLTSGNTRSCGCLVKEIARQRCKARTVHGKKATPEHGVWATMKARCSNPKVSGYQNYGGRGIKVCERWAGSFLAFLEDMGTRPSPKHSIDRIDKDGNYEPKNCRWATRHEQARNRSDNLVIEHGGERLTLAEWSERTGLKGMTIKNRLHRGWTVEQTLTLPLMRRN